VNRRHPDWDAPAGAPGRGALSRQVVSLSEQ
jgi:hypothetical protein